MRHGGLVLTSLGLSLFLFCTPVFSQPSTSENTAVAAAHVHSDWLAATVSLSGGYRVDSLEWNIAGGREGRNPNVLSELEWSGMDIYQLKLALRSIIRETICLRGALDYGTIVDGENRDSDYDGNNRTRLSSRSDNGVDGNHVWDASIGIGPAFAFAGNRLTVCPLVGYAIARQDLNIVDGYQSVASSSTPVGSIDGLDSRYEATWQGPWIGFDLGYQTPVNVGPFTSLALNLSGEFHWVEYDADANWNLRGDLRHPRSFSHAADGEGIILAAGIVMQSKHHWGVRLGIDMTRMSTDEGKDRIFSSDGTTSVQQLNEVDWRSVTVEAGLTWQF